MSKWILAAGAAAIALSVPALSQPGNKGGGGGGGGPAKVERGGGGDRAAKGPRVEQAARGGGEMRGGGQREARAPRVERVAETPRQARTDKVRGPDRAAVRGSERKVERSADRGTAKVDRQERRVARDMVRDEPRVVAVDRTIGPRGGVGLIDGCPPGLAAKNNGCLPPGQARKLVGAVLPAALGANMLEGPFRQWYQDNDQYYYRNDGDYIYRVSRNGGLIDALIPYGAQDFAYYPVGMNYPGDYNFYNVPDQFRPYYADSSDYLYRYGNNAIYQLDPQTNAIQSIAALLAGDLAVGQPLPASYSMYNVPLAYRDRYYDSPDALYRYNDGDIYRADPTTQLITAVIDAIV